MTHPVPTAQSGPDQGPPAPVVLKKYGPPRRALRADLHTLSLLGILAVLVAVGGITEPDASWTPGTSNSS